MDAVKFLESYRAMCDANTDCGDCPLHGTASAWALGCAQFAHTHPRQAVDIVEAWSNRNRDAVEKAAQSLTVRRGDILDKAKACVCRDRNKAYGEPEDGFNLIAALWEPVIRETCVSPGADVSVLPETVAMLMALLKVARAAQNPAHLDSWVDLSGYAACGGEIASKEAGEE